MSRLSVRPASQAPGGPSTPSRAPLPAVLLRPAGSRLSWRVVACASAFGGLLIALLTLGGLALRPRPLTALAFAEPPPLPAVLAEPSPPPAPAPIPPPPPPEPKGFAGGLNLGTNPVALVSQGVQKPSGEIPVAAEADDLPPGAEVATNACGTSVAFVTNPRQAARKAREEERLLFTVHVSGNFEDPGFT